MASAQANRRSEPISSLYKYKAAPLLLGSERFKVSAQPLGSRGTPTPLDDMLTQFSWEDQNAEMEGSLSLTDPSGALKLAQGQKIVCQWAEQEDDPFSQLWALQVLEPTVGLQAQSITAPLTSTLKRVNTGTDNYSYRKSKSHPRGWTCDEIAHDVSKRTHVPVGKLARGTHRITNLVLHAAKPMDVIIRAYKAERIATKRLFFVYWDGRLNILPLKPSADLLMFAGALIDASLQEKLRPDFATAITVRATTKGKTRTTKAGKKTKVARSSQKISYTVKSDAGIRRYGYVHREVHAPDVHTRSEAKAFGLSELAKVINPERTLQIVVPIRPTLKRGDAFTIGWGSQGRTQVCFVAGLQHSVSPGNAQTTITASFTSPVQDAKAAADAAARAAKASERGRASGGTPATTGGTSSQAKRRR